jgi:hypothetical protein
MTLLHTKSFFEVSMQFEQSREFDEFAEFQLYINFYHLKGKKKTV